MTTIPTARRGTRVREDELTHLDVDLVLLMRVHRDGIARPAKIRRRWMTFEGRSWTRPRRGSIGQNWRCGDSLLESADRERQRARFSKGEGLFTPVAAGGKVFECVRRLEEEGMAIEVPRGEPGIERGGSGGGGDLRLQSSAGGGSSEPVTMDAAAGSRLELCLGSGWCRPGGFLVGWDGLCLGESGCR